MRTKAFFISGQSTLILSTIMLHLIGQSALYNYHRDNI